jgi:trimethyllysine dioxygenase
MQVFTLNEDKELVMFRYNNDDRAVLDSLSMDQIRTFYECIPDLLRTTRDPHLGLKTKLRVGDMLVIDNNRVLHGRESFVGMRNLVGAYVDRDDFESRARVLGLLN